MSGDGFNFFEGGDPNEEEPDDSGGISDRISNRSVETIQDAIAACEGLMYVFDVGVSVSHHLEAFLSNTTSTNAILFDQGPITLRTQAALEEMRLCSDVIEASHRRTEQVLGMLYLMDDTDLGG